MAIETGTGFGLGKLLTVLFAGAAVIGGGYIYLRNTASTPATSTSAVSQRSHTQTASSETSRGAVTVDATRTVAAQPETVKLSDQEVAVQIANIIEYGENADRIRALVQSNPGALAIAVTFNRETQALTAVERALRRGNAEAFFAIAGSENGRQVVRGWRYDGQGDLSQGATLWHLALLQYAQTDDVALRENLRQIVDFLRNQFTELIIAQDVNGETPSDLAARLGLDNDIANPFLHNTGDIFAFDAAAVAGTNPLVRAVSSYYARLGNEVRATTELAEARAQVSASANASPEEINRIAGRVTTANAALENIRLTLERWRVMIRLILQLLPDALQGRMDEQTVFQNALARRDEIVLRSLSQSVGVPWVEENRDYAVITPDGQDNSLHIAIRRLSSETSQDRQALLIELIRHFATREDMRNAQGQDGHTPLTLTAQYGLTQIYDVLVQAGADVNLRNAHGHLSIHEAVIHNQGQMVRHLLQREVQPDVTTMLGEESVTSLQMAVRASSRVEAGSEAGEAARAGYDNIAFMLLEAGANMDVNIELGTTLVAYWWRKGMYEYIKRAWRIPELRNSLLAAGLTPLQVVAALGDVNMAEGLESDQASFQTWMRAHNEHGNLPIHVAAALGHQRFVEHLVQHYQSQREALTAESSDYRGFTPLLIAAAFDQVDVVRALLIRGVNRGINVEQRGLNVLAVAAMYGSHRVIQMLADEFSGLTAEFVNSHIEVFMGDGTTTPALMAPVHLAVRGAMSAERRLETIRVLLRVPQIDVAIQQIRDGRQSGTAMYMAAAAGLADIVELLHRHNAQLYLVRTDRGAMAVHTAAANGRQGVLGFFLDMPGFNAHVTDNPEDTREELNDDVSEGARSDNGKIKKKKGRNIADYAAEGGHFEELSQVLAERPHVPAINQNRPITQARRVRRTAPSATASQAGSVTSGYTIAPSMWRPSIAGSVRSSAGIQFMSGRL